MTHEIIPFAQMRKQFGYSQEQIARALDVTPRTVIYWESGHHEPRLTVAQLKSICRLFRIRHIDSLPDNLFTDCKDHASQIAVKPPKK